MQFIFVDDSKQLRPLRQGMGPLMAIGGVMIKAEKVSALESGIEGICIKYGFPDKEVFKWSPGRELWMRSNLVEDNRKRFFTDVMTLAQRNDARAIVVVNDVSCSCATDTRDHETDLMRLFFERVSWGLSSEKDQAVIVVDRPGGGSVEEEKFLFKWLETQKRGTEFIDPKRFPISALSSSSKFIRLLQLADLITSCTLAFISGEKTYSSNIFNFIRPVLRKSGGRIGGVGLKIHPDYKYANLYHWLLGDSQHCKGPYGAPMPLVKWPYYSSEDVYSSSIVKAEAK